MSSNTLNLTPELYDYLQKMSLREPEALQKLRAQTRKMSTAGMQISPEQGQFMRLLIELMGARKTLDIGVFTGYSALSVALALPDDGKVVACDINDEWTGIGRRFWRMAGVEHKIDLRIAPAIETLQGLIEQGQANTFDFAFIDADKLNYMNYFNLAIELIRPGGLIAVDNVLWGGDVANPAIDDENTACLRAFNAMLLHDQRISLSLIPMGDGITLARKVSLDNFKRPLLASHAAS